MLDAINTFARVIFGMTVSMLLFSGSLAAMGAEAGLPFWRYALAGALLAGAALVFKRFVSDEEKKHG